MFEILTEKSASNEFDGETVNARFNHIGLPQSGFNPRPFKANFIETEPPQQSILYYIQITIHYVTKVKVVVEIKNL